MTSAAAGLARTIAATKSRQFGPLRRAFTLLLTAWTMAACSAAAAGADPTPPVPRAPLASLISFEDYPSEALAKGEQGTVSLRLDVGRDGRVKTCHVPQSSGSKSLDTSTCGLILRRARFNPAMDTAGMAVDGSFATTIKWTLGNRKPVNIRLNMMTVLWMTCVNGEAAKLVLSERDATSFSDVAFVACAALEAGLLAELTNARLPKLVPAEALAGLKEQTRARLVKETAAVRKTLADAP